MISRAGFQKADLFSAFAKPVGSPIDFILKEDLLIGRVKVPTKSDCIEWHNREASKHTS